jgi:hypothetical protein
MASLFITATLWHEAPIASAQSSALPSAAVAPSITDSFRIAGDRATSWSAGRTRVVLVEGDVKLTADAGSTTLSARQAVLWITPSLDLRTYRVEVALLGDASVKRGDVVREGGEIFVTAVSRPDIQVTAGNLLERDRSNEDVYARAAALRTAPPSEPAAVAQTAPAFGVPATAPTTAPAGKRGATTRPASPVTFQSDRAEVTATPDGKLAIVLSGKVLLFQTRENGDRVQLQADSAVLFTSLVDVPGKIAAGTLKDIDPARDIEAAYLEGDARISFTPQDDKRSEQRLRASRLLYDFKSDRALLTDAVFQTTDVRTQLPLVVRAGKIRRTATDTYEARHAQFSTSSFAKPQFTLGASKVTIRQEPSADPREGTRTTYDADNVTFRTFDVPWFYLPVVAGSMTERGGALRSIGSNSATGFGFGVQTKWGLFETLGVVPPRNTDASYNLDYYSARGFAGGIDGTYRGTISSEDERLPSTYEGSLQSYFARDFGTDRLGGKRRRIEWDDDFRGRATWKHQQFFADDFQLQLQLGYATDATFREEWFENEFNNGLPIDNSIYLKKQSDNEVLSFYANYDVVNVATTADELQERVVNPDGNLSTLYVQRLPELQYHRIGQEIGDSVTWHSNNSIAALRFSQSRANFNGGGPNDLGFRKTNGPGVPSYGYTGYSGDETYRVDLRQEWSLPLDVGNVRAVPFAMLRYTGASESPDSTGTDRLMAGVGLRTSTTFWKTYDDVKSELFDVNRVRHIVEPQVNLFASAATADRNDFYIYDEGIDGVSDIQAAQFVLKQKWQTKRGAPDRQRTVDFVTLDVGANAFANKPPEPGESLNGELLTGKNFRGQYFSSLPEASQARPGLFANFLWRISDTTALLSDANWNVDEGTLATTSAGFSVQRDPRMRYYLGVRYIGEVNNTIATFAMNYQISAKYSLSVVQSLRLDDVQNQVTSVTLNRQFEQFTFSVQTFYDPIDDTSGISFSFVPTGLSRGISTDELGIGTN